MDDIEEQSFWNKLNPDFKKSVKELRYKYKIVNSYEKVQKYGMIVITIYFIIYFRKDIILGKLNFDSMEFYVIILIVGGFFTLMERIMKNPKKDMERIKTAIKNKMIIKVCTCHAYCECKEDFNDYMKKNGVKILT